MRLRFALALALVLGFLAAPTLALAAGPACAPCCERTADDPCEAESCAALSAVRCCDGSSPADASTALRLAEVSLIQGGLAPRPEGLAAPPSAPRPAEPARRVADTPQRLSVVLRR